MEQLEFDFGPDPNYVVIEHHGWMSRTMFCRIYKYLTTR